MPYEPGHPAGDAAQAFLPAAAGTASSVAQLRRIGLGFRVTQRRLFRPQQQGQC